MKRWLRSAPRWFVRATALLVVLVTSALVGTTSWTTSPAGRRPRTTITTDLLVGWLELRARLGSVDAQAILARAYEEGREAPYDRARSLVWYRRAAANGHVGAQYALGEALYRSQGPGELAESLSWWAKAGAAGHEEAQRQLAHRYSYVDPQPAEAVAWWRRMAARGDTDATENLAWALHTGWGVERNQQESLTLWRQLARAGNVTANYYLGEAAALGDGVPQDRAAAVQLWRKDKALPPRYMEKRWLALCQAYANGDGIARDPVDAAYWCVPIGLDPNVGWPMNPEGEAAAQHLETAPLSVIHIVEQRRAKAEALTIMRGLVPELRTRAQAGDARAQWFLAEALTHRQWADCKPAEATVWYTRAAAQGIKSAINLLAQLKKGHMTLCQ